MAVTLAQSLAHNIGIISDKRKLASGKFWYMFSLFVFKIHLSKMHRYLVTNQVFLMLSLCILPSTGSLHTKLLPMSEKLSSFPERRMKLDPVYYHKLLVYCNWLLVVLHLNHC